MGLSQRVQAPVMHGKDHYTGADAIMVRLNGRRGDYLDPMAGRFATKESTGWRRHTRAL